MNRLAAVVLMVGLAACSSHASAASSTGSGRVRAVVSFVGDSNIVFGATQITEAFTGMDAPYAMVILARVGATIRASDCPLASSSGCSDGAFWNTRLGHAPKSDGFVVDLGINDTAEAGTATTAGYRDYGSKIDWLLRLLPSGVPVWWSDLPCSIEPADRLVGCRAVNGALHAATARWSNLTVVSWAAHAFGHREFMRPEPAGVASVHYSPAGYVAWSSLMVSVLNAQFV